MPNSNLHILQKYLGNVIIQIFVFYWIFTKITCVIVCSELGPTNLCDRSIRAIAFENGVLVMESRADLQSGLTPQEGNISCSLFIGLFTTFKGIMGSYGRMEIVTCRCLPRLSVVPVLSERVLIRKSCFASAIFCCWSLFCLWHISPVIIVSLWCVNQDFFNVFFIVEFHYVQVLDWQHNALLRPRMGSMFENVSHRVDRGPKSP